MLAQQSGGHLAQLLVLMKWSLKNNNSKLLRDWQRFRVSIRATSVNSPQPPSSLVLFLLLFCFLSLFFFFSVVVLSVSCARLFWDPMDSSSPGSSVHGTSMARILEWVTISSSRGSSRPRDWPVSPASPAFQADSLLLNHQGLGHFYFYFCHEFMSKSWSNYVSSSKLKYTI